MCIIVVGGFGASENYTKRFAQYLQYYTMRPVINCALFHGKTFKEEVTSIINKIQQTKYTGSFVIMGFSTGCMIALELSNHLKTEFIILCNPAEILTRFSYEFISSALQITSVTGIDVIPEHIRDLKPAMKTSKVSKNIWIFCLKLFFTIWTIIMYLLGSLRMAQLYYRLLGKNFKEPHFHELKRVVFSTKFEDLLYTISDCLLRQNVMRLLKNCKRPITILLGKNDHYSHLSNHILEYHYCKVKRVDGNHHMLYHKPIESALAAADIILSKHSSTGFNVQVNVV